VNETRCAADADAAADDELALDVDSYEGASWRIGRLKAAFMHCARHHCPLVIHGRPGSGRTSMIAAVSQFCRSWLSSPHAAVVARVLASSTSSLTIEYVLSTICYQISAVSCYPAPDTSGTGYCFRSNSLFISLFVDLRA